MSRAADFAAPDYAVAEPAVAVRPPVAVFAPVRPLVSGAAQFNTSMVKALRDHGPVEALSWDRLYPPLIHRRDAEEGPTEGQGSAEPAVSADRVLDWPDPRSWKRAVDRAVDAGAEALVLPWLHPVMALPYSYMLRAARGRMTRVVICHNVLPHSGFPGARALTRATLRHADLFVTHAPHQRAELNALGLGATPVQELFHPRFVPDDLAPAPPLASVEAERLRQGSPRLALLAFGAVRPYKGIDIALRALRDLNCELDVRLTVAGCFWDGGEELRRLAAELGVESRVEFRDGFVPHDEAALLFAAADACLLPYRSASQSGVVQLSFAYGTPVIATSVGGLPAAVREGRDGLLCEPEDPRALARAIETFAARRVELTAGVDASAHWNSFDRYAELLSAAIEEHSSARGLPPLPDGDNPHRAQSRPGLMHNSALALLGDVASKVGALAVLLIAARTAPTAAFARIASVVAAAGILTAALDLGAQTVIAREGASGPAARGRIFRALALARLPLLGMVVGGAAIFGLLSADLFGALAAALLGLTGAALLSLSGLVRSAQDLSAEARARVLGAVVGVGAVAGAGVAFGSATALIAALLAASVVPVALLGRAATRSAQFTRGDRPGRAFLLALPVGLMALGTIAYYRSGTLVLAALSSPAETSRFAVASTAGFALLAVGNSVTTALLPRLAAESDLGERVRCTRRALGWSALVCGGLAVVAALLAGPVIPLVFGARYRDAALPFALLALSTALIAPAGILGTALFAAGRIKTLARQVTISLAANLAALFVLVPRLGAPGAALATVVCETVALGLLIGPAARLLPGLFDLPALGGLSRRSVESGS